MQGAKTNQQRSGERKGSRSLGQPLVDYPVLLEKEGRCETRRFQRLKQSESTPFHGSAYLSRFFYYFSAARLREMAFEKRLTTLNNTKNLTRPTLNYPFKR